MILKISPKVFFPRILSNLTQFLIHPKELPEALALPCLPMQLTHEQSDLSIIPVIGFVFSTLHVPHGESNQSCTWD